MELENVSVTFEQVKKFIVANYKSSRLYGNEDNKKGDRIINMYLDDINQHGRSIISRHESNTNESISFTSQDITNFSS